MFSSLIDISTFFIGILINLLLVALICYYFKSKIDNLELSQAEQAKVLYSIIQQNQQAGNELTSPSQEQSNNNTKILSNIDFSSLDDSRSVEEHNVVEQTNNSTTNEVSDEESDSCSSMNESDDECSDVEEPEYCNTTPVKTKMDIHTIMYNEELIQERQISDEESEKGDVADIKEIPYEQGDIIKPNDHSDSSLQRSFEKLTVKELKSIIEEKGIINPKKYIKKHDLIQLLMDHEETEHVINQTGNNTNQTNILPPIVDIQQTQTNAEEVDEYAHQVKDVEESLNDGEDDAVEIKHHLDQEIASENLDVDEIDVSCPLSIDNSETAMMQDKQYDEHR